MAFPDYRFDRLRRESPEQYETYAELELARWTHMRINVKGQRAVLYLNNQDKPAFIVNDLKLGSNQRGGVGVWLESGTVAYFRELKIRKEPQRCIDQLNSQRTADVKTMMTEQCCHIKHNTPATTSDSHSHYLQRALL